MSIIFAILLLTYMLCHSLKFLESVNLSLFKKIKNKLFFIFEFLNGFFS